MASKLVRFYPGNDLYVHAVLDGQVYNVTLAALESPQAANWADYVIAATEVGSSGYYEIVMPAVAAGAWKLVVYQQEGGSPASDDSMAWTEDVDWDGSSFVSMLDVLASLSLISSGDITVVGPVLAGGDVITYRGDSYLAADGRSLEWSSDGWPNLTGASIAVIINNRAEFAGSVITPTGTAVVRLELTGSQSESIADGRRNFQVVATVSGKEYTLVAAAWVSRARSVGA